MAYYCVHCEHRFEPEGEGAPRCPKCMRARDLRKVGANDGKTPVAAAAASNPGSGASRLWIGAAGLVIVVASAWALWPEPPAADGATDAGAAADNVLETLGETRAAAESWLDAGDAGEAFAEQATAGASGDPAKAEAVFKAIRARAQKAAFVPWSLGEPRRGPGLPPADLRKAIAGDNARLHLYPIEIAAFMVSLLASQDVPSRAVELTSWPDARAPLDPSGLAGYFAVEAGEGDAARIYDPYLGRTVPASAERTPLGRAQLAGAGLSIEALQLLSDAGDVRGALTLSDAALKLAPTSPSVRSVRGSVLVGAGQVEQGLDELRASAQLRRDAPRRHNLAASSLLTGDIEGATRDLNKLVAEMPDFALARVSLASLELRHGNLDEAHKQLDLAERASPDLSAILWGRAELAFARQDPSGAKALALRAFEANDSLENHVRFAQLQRQTGDISGAAAMALHALEKAPDYRRVELREAFSRALGAAVMADVNSLEASAADGTEGASPGAAEFPASGDLDLSKGLKLLESDAPSAGGADTAEPGAADGPLLLLGDPSKLRLRDPNAGLKLKLGE